MLELANSYFTKHLNQKKKIVVFGCFFLGVGVGTRVREFSLQRIQI